MSPIIEVKGLSKTYASGFQALKGVDLEIDKGEIFALLGPNGAGKTTLISIVCGIVTSLHGQGRRSTATTSCSDYRAARDPHRPGAAGADHRRLRDGLGHGELSAAACSASRATPRTSRRCCATCRCGTSSDSQIMTLSGGMKRRVMIAKALAHEPRHPVPRRADRRRGRGAAPRHVGHGARAARRRRHHHPDHPLHRGGRGDGRPHRRDQQRRADPGGGEGRR